MIKIRPITAQINTQKFISNFSSLLARAGLASVEKSPPQPLGVPGNLLLLAPAEPDCPLTFCHIKAPQPLRQHGPRGAAAAPSPGRDPVPPRGAAELGWWRGGGWGGGGNFSRFGLAGAREFDRARSITTPDATWKVKEAKILKGEERESPERDRIWLVSACENRPGGGSPPGARRVWKR